MATTDQAVALLRELRDGQEALREEWRTYQRAIREEVRTSRLALREELHEPRERADHHFEAIETTLRDLAQQRVMLGRAVRAALESRSSKE